VYPHRVDADSTYHPDADPDPTFHPDANPDPDPDPCFKKTSSYFFGRRIVWAQTAKL
jgi:hypothetical protein